MPKEQIKNALNFATIAGGGILALTAGLAVMRNVGRGKLPAAMTVVTLLTGVAATTYAIQERAEMP